MNSTPRSTNYDDFLVSLSNLLEKVNIDEGSSQLINSHGWNSMIMSCYALRAKQLNLMHLSDIFLLASYALQTKEIKLIVYRKGASRGVGMNKVSAIVNLRSQTSYDKTDMTIEQLELNDDGRIVWAVTTDDIVKFIKNISDEERPSTNDLVTAMEMAFALGDAWEETARELESKLFDHLHNS